MIGCQHLLVVVIFLLCGFTLCADEFNLYVISNNGSSGEIKIYQKDSSGISLFGNIRYEKANIFINYESEEQNFCHTLCCQTSCLTVKHENIVLGKSYYLNEYLYDKNGILVFIAVQDGWGYSFKDNNNNFLGRLEFRYGFSRIHVYSQANKAERSLLFLMAARKIFFCESLLKNGMLILFWDSHLTRTHCK